MKSLLNVLKSPLVWIFLALILPEMAFATQVSPEMFTLSSTDLSKTMFIDRLFPDDGKGPFSSLMLAFSAAIMFAFGVMSIYILTVGTINTAHDGEALGKKWSTMWLPVRFAISSALAFPNAAGISGAMAMAIYIIKMSCAMGSFIWAAVAFNMPEAAFAVSSVPTEQLEATAVEMVKNNVCVSSLQKLRDSPIADTIFGVGEGKKAFPVGYTGDFDNSGSYQIQWGISKNPITGTKYQAICGRMILTKNTTANDSGYSDGIGTSVLKDAQSEAMDQVQAQLWETHRQQFLVLQEKMAAAATSYLNTHSSILPKVQQGVRDYNKAVTAQAVKLTANNAVFKNLASNMAKDGWFSASLYFTQMAAMQNLISSAVSHTPDLTAKTERPDAFEQEVAADQIMLNADLALEQKNLGSSSVANIDGNDDSTLSFLISPGKWITKHMVKAFSQGNLLFTSGNQHVHPLLADVQLGESVINVAWVIFTVGLIAAKVAGGAAAAVLAPLVIGFFGTLAAAGMALELLAFLPFSLFFMAIVAYMLVCVEFLFASPLFALAHADPEGHEVYGRAGSAWSLAFSILFTPSLLIAGFVGANAVLVIAGELLSKQFAVVLTTTLGSNTVAGPVVIIGLLFFYVGMQIAMIRLTIGEIPAFPDRVLKWLGMGAQSISSLASQGHQQASQQHTAIMGAAVSTKNQAAQGGAQLANAKAADNARAQEAKNQARNQAAMNAGVGMYKAPEKPGDDAPAGSTDSPDTPKTK